MMKPIIIEFTGLPGSGKSTILNCLSDKHNFPKDVFLYTDKEKNKLLPKSKFINYISYFLFVLFNIKYFFRYFTIIKNAPKKINKFNIIFYRLYKLSFVKEKKVVVFDEFLLQSIPGRYMTNAQIDSFLNKGLGLNIFPIYFDVKDSNIIKRTDCRNKKSMECFDKLDYDTKLSNLKILKKTGIYRIKKYCDLLNIDFISIDGNNSLDENIQNTYKGINNILKVNKVVNG